MIKKKICLIIFTEYLKVFQNLELGFSGCCFSLVSLPKSQGQKNQMRHVYAWSEKYTIQLIIYQLHVSQLALAHNSGQVWVSQK